MIFRQYQIDEDGNFHFCGNTSLTRGSFDYFKSADSFLDEVGEDFFPTIKIQEHDNISDDYRECLLQMFFMKQLKFFLNRGLSVIVADLDCRKVEIFGQSGLQDYLHAKELKIKNPELYNFVDPETTNRLVYSYLYNCGPKAFWIERFNSYFLVIHVTRKKVLKPEALHCKK